MKKDDVFDRFCLLADLSYEEAQPHRCLCEDAFASIHTQQKEGLPPGADSILCTAAAALALYHWALIRRCDGEQGFSAGSLHVNADGRMGVEMARRAWEESKALAAPYLLDAGFLFERIRS